MPKKMDKKMDLRHVNEILEAVSGILGYGQKYKVSGGKGRLLVKFNSHRARKYGAGSLANRKQFCSFHRSVGYGVYEVTPEELESLKKNNRAKYFSKFKDGDDLFACWESKWVGDNAG